MEDAPASQRPAFLGQALGVESGGDRGGNERDMAKVPRLRDLRRDKTFRGSPEPRSQILVPLHPIKWYLSVSSNSGDLPKPRWKYSDPVDQ